MSKTQYIGVNAVARKNTALNIGGGGYLSQGDERVCRHKRRGTAVLRRDPDLEKVQDQRGVYAGV